MLILKGQDVEIERPYNLTGVNENITDGINGIGNVINHNAKSLNQLYDYIEYLEKRISTLEKLEKC